MKLQTKASQITNGGVNNEFTSFTYLPLKLKG
jgi:hypothetical protein